MAPTTPPPDASFASDNASGVHPAVMEALAAANTGHALAYGMDAWTGRATAAFAELLGAEAEVAFTFGGTGANVVGLACMLEPWQAVICPDGAHIAVDECGAPERFTGSKLMDVPCPDGKLRPEQVTSLLHGLGDEHHVQPRVVSVTQSTELGTLYTLDELGALVEVAHSRGLLVHLDGARLGNAAAALGCGMRELVVDTGVDVVSFGGTKNGMMYGEAVLFLRPELAHHARFVRKQAAQLPSKMRFVAAQFEALLADDLWIRNAAHANAMAARLAAGAASVPGVEIVASPQVNAVFAALPPAAVEPLLEWSRHWVWDHERSVVRWMCSFDTRPEDVDHFVAGLTEIVTSRAGGTAAG